MRFQPRPAMAVRRRLGLGKTLREEPGYRKAPQSKAVACAHLDRIEEARAALSQLIESLRHH
jgi:hypothetical protein